MKSIFTLQLILLISISGLRASGTEDEPVAQPEKKHHFNWLIEAQPVIPVGNFISHQVIGGPIARLLSPVTDSTYKFINTMYMASFKGSAGYQYKHLFYIGLGSGVQFGRQLANDTGEKITDVMVPFFADMRVTYGNRIQFYYQQTAGYTLYFNHDLKQNDTIYLAPRNQEGVYINSKPFGGFFMQSSLGGKINLKKISISAGLAYQLSYVMEKYTAFEVFSVYPYNRWFTFPYTTTEMRHSLVITFGVSF